MIFAQTKKIAPDDSNNCIYFRLFDAFIFFRLLDCVDPEKMVRRCRRTNPKTEILNNLNPQIMKNLIILIALVFGLNLHAQNPDLIHRAADKKTFPISGKQFLEITGTKAHYFTSYKFGQTKFYDMAVTVTGIDTSGKRFIINLEVDMNEDGVFFYTGDAECCRHRLKPLAKFSPSFRCVRGGEYEFIKNGDYRW